MKGFIGDIDWVNAEAQKYWSIPASYSDEKRKSEVVNAIYSGDYYGALKVDGYYQRLIKDEDGNCFMVARNKNVRGEAVNKIEWVPQIQDFMAQLPNGTVLFVITWMYHIYGTRFKFNVCTYIWMADFILVCNKCGNILCVV